jgi:hypothetical protein
VCAFVCAFVSAFVCSFRGLFACVSCSVLRSLVALFSHSRQQKSCRTSACSFAKKYHSESAARSREQAMVCGGIVVIGPDGVPRPGTPYVAPPEPPASVRFAGSPLVTISDFLAEFELLHLAEPLKASGAPAELYALYLAEGRTAFLNSLKAAGVANLKDRQAMANNLSKAGKG